MRENITSGDVSFRKAYLRSFIDAVEVGDNVIRIHGSKSTLKQAVIACSQKTCQAKLTVGEKLKKRQTWVSEYSINY
jgi:hypothetical protein